MLTPHCHHVLVMACQMACQMVCFWTLPGGLRLPMHCPNMLLCPHQCKFLVDCQLLAAAEDVCTSKHPKPDPCCGLTAF